jgi:hypothetical protein
VVSLSALTGNDRDIVVIGEQREGSAEVLRRETVPEVVDRCENPFVVGHASH